MIDANREFNANQKSAIRWMATNAKKHPMKEADLMSAAGMTESDCRHLLRELGREKNEYIIPLLGGKGLSDFAILAGIDNLVRQLDNPPPKDYWKDLTIWFKSKWWSVPVFVLGVGFAAIAAYIAVTKTLLEWFGWK